MKLQIDNLDGNGPRDYTTAVDGTRSPQVIRKLNQVFELRVSLVADGADFVVPVTGARVMLGRTNGQDVFTGYLMQPPVFEYLGWGERGPVYRYNLLAQSDEILLDEKRLPERSPFVERSAGNALRQLTQDAMPGLFDTSAVQGGDILAEYVSDPQTTWSQQAAEIAIEARSSYRVINGTLIFSPIGATVYTLNESDSTFSPEGLQLQLGNTVINDLTVIGEMEPQAYVRDYFVGDGLTTRFYLSQKPFTKSNQTFVDEEYSGSALDLRRWTATDPANAVSVANGKLQIAGGTGSDGATLVQFVEKIELGGATILQHGDILFNAASGGVIGGLYSGGISITGCLAGFLITPNGAGTNIQALVNGAAAGTILNTIAGHHYVFTTRIYTQEIYRRQQIFHSSMHSAGNGIGGAEVSANVRLVLEVHDIDPANPGSQIAPSTVLYDGVATGAIDFCNYALVNASNLHCSVAFTRFIHAVDTEVHSALTGQNYVTRLVGALSDGAECNTTSSELTFFSAHVPAANQSIAVQYRGLGRALAQVTNPASIAALQRGIDNGIHGTVKHIKLPPARTAADCENAALAFLEDSLTDAWTGEYDVWSDFLPNAATDIFPGDGIQINVPSRGAAFLAIVREVEIDHKDLANEHSIYKIKFAQDGAKSLSFEFQAAKISTFPDLIPVTNTQVGTVFLPSLTSAQVTAVTSTTITVDAGMSPTGGGGFEVRWSDSGWGPDNDRNLVGRFATQIITLPRLGKVQTYFLQQYDSSNPPRYSRYSAALHIDYPLL
ncbi:MAG TPA: hypothetical protein VFA74_09720 [Terriglobales bacterium]|nr:hypothetical protein [Terriglobales bacterium]